MAHQVGKNQVAADLIGAAIKVSPTNPLYFNNFGEACKALGRLQQAEGAYRHATKIAPAATDVWLNLGNLLLQQDRYDEAIEVYRECLALDPKFASARFNLATALLEHGDPDEAIELLESLLKETPNNAQLHSHYGLMLQRTGTGDATAHYLKAIELQPNEAEFYYQLASTAPEQLEPEHIADLKSMIATDPNADAAHFSLGNYYHIQGDHQSAWQAFTAGNQAQSHTQRSQSGPPNETSQPSGYMRQQNETLTQRIVKQYCQGFFATPAQEEREDYTPIYLVSMPRSGSTLVERILASHPEASGLGESRVLHQIQKLLVAGDAQNRDFPMAAADLTIEQCQQFGHEIEKRTHASRDTRWTIDKTLDNHRFLGLIAQLQPNARVIVCQRDPRDIFVSCYSHRFKNLPHTRNLQDLQHYFEQFQILVEHWKTALPLPIHTVHYEALVKSPALVTRQLVDFCGMPWSEECQNFHKGKGTVKTASIDQVRKPIYTSSVGRWQAYADFLR